MAKRRRFRGLGAPVTEHGVRSAPWFDASIQAADQAIKLAAGSVGPEECFQALDKLHEAYTLGGQGACESSESDEQIQEILTEAERGAAKKVQDAFDLPGLTQQATSRVREAREAVTACFSDRDGWAQRRPEGYNPYGYQRLPGMDPYPFLPTTGDTAGLSGKRRRRPRGLAAAPEVHAEDGAQAARKAAALLGHARSLALRGKTASNCALALDYAYASAEAHGRAACQLAMVGAAAPDKTIRAVGATDDEALDKVLGAVTRCYERTATLDDRWGRPAIRPIPKARRRGVGQPPEHLHHDPGEGAMAAATPLREVVSAIVERVEGLATEDGWTATSNCQEEAAGLARDLRIASKAVCQAAEVHPTYGKRSLGPGKEHYAQAGAKAVRFEQSVETIREKAAAAREAIGRCYAKATGSPVPYSRKRAPDPVGDRQPCLTCPAEAGEGGRIEF